MKLAESFLKMIKGNATEEDMDALEEAGALQDISHILSQSKMCCFGMAYHGRTVKRGKIDRMYIYRSY